MNIVILGKIPEVFESQEEPEKIGKSLSKKPRGIQSTMKCREIKPVLDFCCSLFISNTHGLE